MAKQVQIKLNEIPDDWSQDAADLINKVIKDKKDNKNQKNNKKI